MTTNKPPPKKKQAEIKNCERKKKSRLMEEVPMMDLKEKVSWLIEGYWTAKIQQSALIGRAAHCTLRPVMPNISKKRRLVRRISSSSTESVQEKKKKKEAVQEENDIYV